MTSPQPISSPMQASPSGSSGMQDMKSVLGVNDNSAQQMNAERMRKQQMDSVSAQIQSLTQALDGIARQFPAAAQSINELQRGLTKVQVQIVGSSMSESQPFTGAMG